MPLKLREATVGTFIKNNTWVVLVAAFAVLIVVGIFTT
jgi:hypothetical protein